MEYKFTKLGLKASDNVKDAYWDNNQKTLKVVFNNNKEYLYEGLDFGTISKWGEAESTGQWFNDNIRSNKSLKFKRIK